MNLSVDRSPVIIIISAIIIPITTILFFLRCYVKLGIQKKKFSADDYVIIFSFVNFIGVQILTVLDVKYGTGKHLVAVLIENPDHVPKTLLTWWIGQHLYLYATCSVKVSVAIFFCSLSPPRPLRITAIVMAITSVVTGIATEVYYLFQCQPISYFWMRFYPGVEGSCLSPYKSWVLLETANAGDILSDVVLALLPAIMLWNMNMRRREKLGVSILLGLGAVPAITAIVRAFYMKEVLLDTEDFTYSEFPMGLTSHLEPAIAICVVCAAHLRPLLRKYLPERWFSSAKGSSDPNVITFGRAGGRPHGVPGISIDDRLDSGVCDEERPDEKYPTSHLHSQKEPSILSENSHCN